MRATRLSFFAANPPRIFRPSGSPAASSAKPSGGGGRDEGGREGERGGETGVRAGGVEDGGEWMAGIECDKEP